MSISMSAVPRRSGAYHADVNAAGVVSVVVDHGDAMAAAMAVKSVPSAAGEGDDRQDQDDEQDSSDTKHVFILPVRSAYPPVRYASGRIAARGYTFE